MRAQGALLVDLEMEVDQGVSGREGSVLHTDCLLDKSAQQRSCLLPSSRNEELHYSDHPDEMSWQI